MDSISGTLSTIDLRIVVLIITCAALYLLENGIPFQENNRKHLSSNIVLTISVLAVNFLFSGITILLLDWAAEANFGILRVLNFHTLTTLLISIVLLDFWAGYLSHITMHHFPILWKFHSIHHSDTMIDVTTTLRQHPLETIFRLIFQTTGAVLLGIPFWMFGIYLLLSAVNAQLEHSNIAFPEKTDKFLRHFYTTPNMHKIHHSTVFKESNSNYGNIFSIWDRIFGTYLSIAPSKKLQYGLDCFENEKQTNSLKYLFALISK